MAAASWIPLAAVSSARAETARPSVSESRSRSSSGAVLWETPSASNSDIGAASSAPVRGQRRLTPASGGGLRLLLLLGDRGHVSQFLLDPLQFRRHDRQVDDEQDHEADVGAGAV